MKALVVYDSVFGNTQMIARAIGTTLAALGTVEVVGVKDVKPEHFTGLQLLIVGSPTRGFKPTSATSEFLQTIPVNGLRGVKVAAFDTRMLVQEARSWILNFLVKLLGSGAYAAKHIADSLKQHGGIPIAAPEGFFVDGREGPLKPQELERANDWVQKILH
jgi:flavodoxin